MTQARTSVFFDLDGTLTDPKPGITGCIQYALERMDRPIPTRDELEWCIGPPLLANFTKLVGAEDAQRGVDLYRERFGEVGLYENEVYAGIPETLGALAGDGVTLYVASSKPHVYVSRILEHFDLTKHFAGVYGSELDGTRTDKRDLLGWAMGDAEVPAQEAIMIGDRGVDAIGALHNEMSFLGVLYGYGSIEELEEAGATDCVHAPTDLQEALGRLDLSRPGSRGGEPIG